MYRSLNNAFSLLATHYALLPPSPPTSCQQSTDNFLHLVTVCRGKVTSHRQNRGERSDSFDFENAIREDTRSASPTARCRCVRRPLAECLLEVTPRAPSPGECNSELS